MKIKKKLREEMGFTDVTSFKQYYENLETQFADKTMFKYFQGKNNIVEMTYGEFVAIVRSMVAGFEATGLTSKRIAIVGETHPKWVASFIATVSSGGVAIPLDKELQIKELCGFLEISEADAIVIMPGYNKHFEEIKEIMGDKIKYILVSTEDVELCDSVIPFDELVSAGEAKIAEGFVHPDYEMTDRMAIMLFTSGTTGTSKCVMLSEKNFAAAVNSADVAVDFSGDDVLVSVLPLHHTYELCCLVAGANYGMTICINDNLKHVLKNFQTFKPTALVLVPLFVNTMYKKIWDTAAKSGKDKTLKIGLKASKAMRSVGIDVRAKLFKEVIDAFGGNLCKIVCGGAALSPEYVEKFEEFGVRIFEGYGITECSPLISVSPYYAPKRASVGPSVPCCQVKIDGGVKNDKGFDEGEICVKGDNVMLGYYKNEEATKDAFTEDGWYRTGDVGYLDNDGYIYITGRKKSVIVLNNGKNVFPEEIEEHLEHIEAIQECVVVGRKKDDSDEVVLTAICYPAFDKFDKEEGIDAIAEKIKAEINEVNKKLPTFKQVRNIEIRKNEFEKTTSRKIKRYLVK